MDSGQWTVGDPFAAVVEAIVPGGRLVRRRRLPGGLTCRMDVLDIERADGSRWKVSLRRFVAHDYDHPQVTPEDVRQEFEVLRLAAEAGVPAPRPVWLDAEGELFGVPSIVQTYLPGRAVVVPRDAGRWVNDLAEALAAIHRVTPGEKERSWLRVQTPETILARVTKRRGLTEGNPLAMEVLSALEARLPTLAVGPPTLIHDDYWPGNLIWYRGKLAGVIDWSDAKMGDPRSDVSCCRVDLVISSGIEVADAFREEYEQAAGRRLRDTGCFDLFRGFEAWLYHEHWVEAYHDLGETHVTAADVGGRLRRFLERALEEARG